MKWKFKHGKEDKKNKSKISLKLPTIAHDTFEGIWVSDSRFILIDCIDYLDEFIQGDQWKEIST